MKTLIAKSNEMADVVPNRGGGVRDWQRWAPYAAVAWSLIYAALGLYWAVSGRGFPFSPETVSDGMGPLLGRFGPGVAWIVVMMAGIPAAALGVAMLRGVRGRALRPLFISCRSTAGGGAPAADDRPRPAGQGRLYPRCHLRPVHSREGPDLPGCLDSMVNDPPIAVPHRWVFLAGSDRQLCPPERGRLLVLRPPGWPGGLEEPGRRKRWGSDCLVCGDGGASLLRHHPLRLGVGNSRWG